MQQRRLTRITIEFPELADYVQAVRTSEVIYDEVKCHARRAELRLPRFKIEPYPPGEGPISSDYCTADIWFKLEDDVEKVIFQTNMLKKALQATGYNRLIKREREETFSEPSLVN